MKTLIKLSSLLALLISYLVVASPVQAADMTNTVTIKVNASEQKQTLLFWQVDKDATLEGLYPLSDGELTKQYGQPKEELLEPKQTELKRELPVGNRYYVRQVSKEEMKEVLAPLLFEVPAGDPLMVIAKYTVPKKTGGYHFVKASSKGGNLAGAVFQVEQQNSSGKSEPVLRNGKPYVLTSGEDGQFEVDNLPYGRYYLREIEAPRGYAKLEKAITFEVTNFSNQEKYRQQVINKPLTPPKIEIPYTGNAIMIIMTLVGFIVFMIGWFLIRKQKDD